MHGSTAAARPGQRTAIERVGRMSTGRDLYFFQASTQAPRAHIQYGNSTTDRHRSTRHAGRDSGRPGRGPQARDERERRTQCNLYLASKATVARRLVLLARARCGCIVFNKRRGQGRACVGQRIHAHRLLIRTATGALGARPTMCKRVIEHVPLATP